MKKLSLLTLLMVFVISCSTSVDSSISTEPFYGEVFEENAMVRSDIAMENSYAQGDYIIKNAYASTDVTSSNFDTTIDEVKNISKQYSGNISNTYLSTNYQGLKSYSMTIKVPSEEFENFLEDVEEVSNFKSININSNDVTTQVLDIDSRLKSLNEEKIALEKIKEEATSTSDKLQVQSQLRYINQDIEIFQNQKEYYENATSYSTLSLDIREGSGVTLFSWNYYVQRALMWVEGIVGVSVSLSIIVIPIILLFFLIKKLRKK
jgi:hypothetical protein